MNWDTVFKIVLSIVGSVGGAGAIIAFVVKFSANLIAGRIFTNPKSKIRN